MSWYILIIIDVISRSDNIPCVYVYNCIKVSQSLKLNSSTSENLTHILLIMYIITKTIVVTM